MSKKLLHSLAQKGRGGGALVVISGVGGRRGKEVDRVGGMSFSKERGGWN